MKRIESMTRQQLLPAADRAAAWARVRGWQEKAQTQTHQESKTHHDHEFKKIINHEDHDPPTSAKTAQVQLSGAALFKLVNTDPAFLEAQKWGCWPQALFNAAKAYGVDKVRASVALVRNYTGVRNRAAYLMASIKNGPAEARPFLR
jgi:hypothetical protein